MPRTRDFVLLLTVIVFLVLAIGTTLVAKYGGATSPGGHVMFDGTTSDRNYQATLYESETISREERLAAMRAKIAENTVISAPPEVAMTTEEAAPSSTEPATDSVNQTTSPKVCSNYAAYTGAWPRSGVEIEAVEGARIVYQEISAPPLPVAPVSGTSSTPALTAAANRSILLQLPIRLGTAASPSCLSSDVVGVANDGSLIRNSEVGLYGVFSDDTLVGYALDGFPIYGRSGMKTDACGGVLVNGQYHYVLSSDRSTIINCFSAPPAKLI